MSDKGNLTILLFGSIREAIGSSQIEVQDMSGKTVLELRNHLANTYHYASDIKTCMVAINQNYSTEDTILHSSNEIALIPPVNGG
jgi:molybdopterin synthase sulfur carrier subunit